MSWRTIVTLPGDAVFVLLVFGVCLAGEVWIRWSDRRKGK